MGKIKSRDGQGPIIAHYHIPSDNRVLPSLAGDLRGVFTLQVGILAKASSVSYRDCVHFVCNLQSKVILYVCSIPYACSG